ncbi:mini-chromosome maintenance replisome factor-domain-containing protein [Lentinula lateritia]|nr:mini-chromosome maintenance replisome factor-domain-containing protein [Lentinula lateritia]
MVSSVPFDILNDPQAAIQELFDQHLQSQSSVEFHSVLSNHFQEIFDQGERLELVNFARTSSNSSSTSPRLVQFRGMVQDTSASPELYLSQLREGKYGGWGAHESMDEHIDYSNLRECTRYWVISVPGETEWARQTRTDAVLASTSRNSNRGRDHKFPLPSTAHIGVHTNIYSVQSDHDLKSTDIATFVGLFEAERDTLHVLFHLHENTAHKPYRVYPLTMADMHESTSLEKGNRALQRELVKWIADESLAGDMDAAEWVLLSIISRVQSRHPPIIPASLTLARFPPPPAKVVPTASTSATPDVHRLAASTNTPALYNVLSLLLPIIAHVPLSLPLLNDGVFFPESKPRPRSESADEDAEDELYSGLLQLAPSTVCLITDSNVTEGQINDRGVRNLRALQEVIRNQTLEYVFPYSVFRFETDIGCIVCTEGKRSALVETHTTIPLRPADSLSTSELQQRLYKSPDELNLPPIEKMEAWRKLIGVPVGGIGVSNAAAELIQEEFVQERQTEAKSSVDRKAQTTITPDDLIHRMLMTKLLALSTHEPEVSIDIWKRMKDLERRRLARMA